MNIDSVKNVVVMLIVYFVYNIAFGHASSNCGGFLRGKKGTFSSPKYPKNYPLNVECDWTIETPKDTAKILITFTDFEIEFSSGCIYDYIKILDQNKKLVNTRLCGNIKYKMTKEVPGNIAHVVFHSDDVQTEKGFQATFEAISSPKPASKGDCDFDSGLCNDWVNDANDDFDWSIGSGETPTALTGPNNDHSGKGKYLFIESSRPRRPGDVARIISSPLRSPRCISFYYFMYGLLGMGKLRVYVRDPSGKNTLIWSRSGDQGREWKKAQFPLPLNVASPFKIVIEGIVGNSDYSDVAIDDITFSNDICVEEGCGGQLSGPSGTFASPNFPDKYPDDSRCTWTITGPAGTKKIIIQFHQFDVQVDTKCSKDYVKVLNKDDKQVGPNYCGFYAKGFGVKIDGNSTKLYFSSNNYIKRSGFNASFETVSSETADDCDFDAAKCSWHNSNMDDFDWTIRGGRTPSFFTGPFGDYLGLGRYAYLESSHRVKGDKAHLVSGSMSGARCMQFMISLHGIHMGKINVLQVYQNGRNLLLSKAGNHERRWHKASVNIPDVGARYSIIIEGVVGGGFTSDAAVDEISFTAGSCPSQASDCGGYLTSPSGVIQSPNFPGNYPNHAACEWVINPLPYYKHMNITFTDFDVECSQNCSNDNVEVADGYRTRIGEKRCGLLKNLKQKTVDIQGSKAHVTFTSDSSKTEHGFRAIYQVSQRKQICGGQLSGTSGNFSSPNYPNNYASNEICEWEITGTRGKWLEISFKDFAIDDTVVCYYNYILVLDGIHGNEIGRYCGMYSPASIYIPSHVTNIRFATSQYGAAPGFRAAWNVVTPKT